ncbi:hypothetical protein CRENBAI_019791 [Crenichthys baileyi]|uniref:Uncharacterized protein n=1 Tax=Crenichthys baileyi TaxID=28760 RepID=A0AAV9SA64_9TELE
MGSGAVFQLIGGGVPQCGNLQTYFCIGGNIFRPLSARSWADFREYMFAIVGCYSNHTQCLNHLYSQCQMCAEHLFDCDLMSLWAVYVTYLKVQQLLCLRLFALVSWLHLAALKGWPF